MRTMFKVLRRIRQAWYACKACLLNNESAIFYLLKEEAEEYLDNCNKLGVVSTEGVEDLIFHINSYLDIPTSLRATIFQGLPNFKIDSRTKSIILDRKEIETSLTEEQLDSCFMFITEVEKERAIEREFICDLLKTIPIGFKI